jgi:hypothetical protein
MYAASTPCEGIAPSSTDEVVRLSSGSVVPMLRAMPGFMSYRSSSAARTGSSKTEVYKRIPSRSQAASARSSSEPR